MADLLVRDEGTVVVFRPATDAAKEWVAENIVSEPWQWLGGRLAVDHRYADSIIQSAAYDGLEVAYES